MTAWGGETGAACLCGVEYLNMRNISTTSEVGVVVEGEDVGGLAGAHLVALAQVEVGDHAVGHACRLR